jgi:hypothetical protein
MNGYSLTDVEFKIECNFLGANEFREDFYKFLSENGIFWSKEKFDELEELSGKWLRSEVIEDKNYILVYLSNGGNDAILAALLKMYCMVNNIIHTIDYD